MLISGVRPSARTCRWHCHTSVVCCQVFLPNPRLPSQWDCYSFLSRHLRSTRLSQPCGLARFEPATFWSSFRRLNHSAFVPSLSMVMCAKYQYYPSLSGLNRDKQMSVVLQLIQQYQHPTTDIGYKEDKLYCHINVLRVENYILDKYDNSWFIIYYILFLIMFLTFTFLLLETPLPSCQRCSQ